METEPVRISAKKLGQFFYLFRRMKITLRLDQILGSFLGTVTAVLLWHWFHPEVGIWQIVKTLMARLI